MDWYCVLVFLGIYSYANKINWPFINAYTGRGLRAFFFGVLLAKYQKKRKFRTNIHVLVIVVVIPLCIRIFPEFMAYGIDNTLLYIFYPAVILLFSSNGMKRLLKPVGKCIGILGNISFDVFVWHIPAMIAMNIIRKWIQIDVEKPVTMIVFTGLIFIWGTMSYYFIEKPVNRLIMRSIK